MDPASVVFPPRAAEAAGSRPALRVLSVSCDHDLTPRLQEWIAMTLSPMAPDEVTLLSSASAKESCAEILEWGNSLAALVGLIAAQIVVEGTIIGALGGVAGLLIGVLATAGISVASVPGSRLLPLLLLLPAASGALGLLSSLLRALSATRAMPSEPLRD